MDIIVNIFSFIAQIFDNTDIIYIVVPIVIAIIFCIILIYYLICFSAKTTFQDWLQFFGLIILIFITVALLNTSTKLISENDYPSNLKYTIHETNYKELSPKNYSRQNERLYSYYLSERAVTKHTATIKYGSNEETIKVVKLIKTYNKPDHLKELDEKYLTAKLQTVKIMPVTVTTNWHGIKEKYKRYQVEEIYDYDLDQDKVAYYSNQEKLENILN